MNGLLRVKRLRLETDASNTSSAAERGDFSYRVFGLRLKKSSRTKINVTMSGFTGRRNKTTQGVELHVFYVPEDQFDRRLNKVSSDAVSAFISAGFIRVDSDMTLSDLRAELGCFLGLDRITDKYVFLKCVGRSLALVKFRQEGELTVKSFSPPFAPFPELYLLPVGEHDSGLCSSSLTPDTLVSSADHHSQDLLRPTCAPGQSKEPIKFPSINKRAQQSVLMPAEEKNGSDEDTQSTDTRHLTYSSHDHKEPEAKQSGIKSSKHKQMD